MQVTLIEHKAKKKTDYGVIEKPLNQYIVMMKREGMPHARQVGYIGTHEGAKFLPLAGFDDELAKDVCRGIQEWLAEHKDKFDKAPEAVPAPPAEEQIQDEINSAVVEDDDE